MYEYIFEPFRSFIEAFATICILCRHTDCDIVVHIMSAYFGSMPAII